MKTIIIAGGTVNEIKSQWLEGSELIIAADGGANHCARLDIMPDYVIGDLDSATEESLKKLRKAEIIKDPDQNKTDLMLAVELAKNKGANEFVFIGAIGNRVDHTLANLLMLSELNNATVVDERNEIWFVNSEITLSGEPEDVVSVVALAETTGLSYEGLKWGMDNETVPFGWIGTSNVMIGNEAKITIKTGRLFVMKARD